MLYFVSITMSEQTIIFHIITVLFLGSLIARLCNLIKWSTIIHVTRKRSIDNPFSKTIRKYSNKRVSPHCAWCSSGPPLLWTWQLNRPSTTYTVHQSWKLDEQSARAFLAKLTDLSEMFLGHCRSVRADAQYSTVAVLGDFCPKTY